MTSIRFYIGTILFLLITFVAFPSNAEQEEGGEERIVLLRLSDVINPVVARFFTEELQNANTQKATAFLLELDTPGGLDSAMRTMVKGMLASDIPTIVFVYPPGGRAASAGAYITLAADFAVMAPGTNIGAATPVALGGTPDKKQDSVMMEKVVNDAVAYAKSLAEKRGRNTDWAEKIVRESISTPAGEALKLGVIDFIAEDEKTLLEGLNGRSYLRSGKSRTLDTKGVQLFEVKMGWVQEILNTISNPNIAYLLLMLGILGIFFEISQPGVILPGTIGAIALLLAFFALQTLPVNYVGILLILLSVVFFILEVKVVSYGMLSVAGIVAMTMGSLILFEGDDPSFRVSWTLIGATVFLTSATVLAVLYFVVRAQNAKFFSGMEGLVGECGEAVTEIHESGRVFVHGEYWNAYSEEPIVEGEKIEILGIGPNMRMKVGMKKEEDI